MASTFYFIGFTPLLERLRAEHDREIDHSIDSGLWLLQGVLGKQESKVAAKEKRLAKKDKKLSAELDNLRRIRAEMEKILK